MTASAFDSSDVAFLHEQLGGLTTQRVIKKVSEWAAENRYLPQELTNKPGKWDNSYTPYLTEIMDCLTPTHPARKIAVRKAGQIGATTGILENAIGYFIAHDPCGMIYVSADDELTKIGMELKVSRMLHHSGLQHLLQASDSRSKRSGDTSRMKEFPGGFLLGVGARNPAKLRSTAARVMLIDELDACPLILGGIGREEGDLPTIADKRTDSYLETRKILYLSTPLQLQTSQITEMYHIGDQRHYHIPCVHCGFYQPLVWHGLTEDGKRFGFTWDTDKTGKLVEDSVGYVCRECFAIFYNHDKAVFLAKGKWVPHAERKEEGFYSYHLPAFYSPIGMYAWKGIARKWFKAWDIPNDRVRDIEKYQTFRNLEEGLAWEVRGESPKAETVRAKRRAIYSEGELPNSYAIKETGAPIVLLTCAADVHKDRLDVEVVAWCQNRQTYSIEWLHFEGDTQDLSDLGPWQPLRELMDKIYIADDLRQYRIEVTLIDASWGKLADEVHQFCLDYSSGVYPCMGRDVPMRGSTVKEFSDSESKFGNTFFNVTISVYKDRLNGWIGSVWAEHQLQPLGYTNYPQDRRDSFFKEYEAEEKKQLLDPTTRQPRGWRWVQIGSRPNHAWDCRVYNMCAFDMVVLEVCIQELELLKLSYADFFKYAVPKKNSEGEWLPNRFSVHPNEVRAILVQ